MNPEELTNSLSGAKPDKSDKEFNNQDNINNHEERYTEILTAYTQSLEKTLKRKLRYKTLIFWLSFVLLCAFPVIIIILLLFGKYSNITEWCAVIIPALISFLTIFIVIPQVITQYLFNADEEKYMSDIIKHIQDYDKKK